MIIGSENVAITTLLVFSMDKHREMYSSWGHGQTYRNRPNTPLQSVLHCNSIFQYPDHLWAMQSGHPSIVVICVDCACECVSFFGQEIQNIRNLVSSASRKVFITTTDLYDFLILASCEAPGLWFISQCRLLHWIQWLDYKVVTLLSHFLMSSRLFCVLCQLHPSKTTVSGGLFQIQNMLGQLCL